MVYCDVAALYGRAAAPVSTRRQRWLQQLQVRRDGRWRHRGVDGRLGGAGGCILRRACNPRLSVQSTELTFCFIGQTERLIHIVQDLNRLRCFLSFLKGGSSSRRHTDSTETTRIDYPALPVSDRVRRSYPSGVSANRPNPTVHDMLQIMNTTQRRPCPRSTSQGGLERRILPRALSDRRQPCAIRHRSRSRRIV